MQNVGIDCLSSDIHSFSIISLKLRAVSLALVHSQVTCPCIVYDNAMIRQETLRRIMGTATTTFSLWVPSHQFRLLGQVDTPSLENDQTDDERVK